MNILKNKILIFGLLVSLVFSVVELDAQVEVLTDNTVKITENISVKRNDTNNPRLETTFSYNVPNSIDVYGIRNSSSGTSKYRTGISNNMYGHTEYEVGIQNNLSSYKLGNTYMAKDGIYNNVYQNDAKYTRGLRNFVTGGSSNGIHDQIYGIENYVSVNHNNGRHYGASNYLTFLNPSPGGTAYASKSYMTGNGSPSNIYGYHSSYNGYGNANPNRVYGYYAYLYAGANTNYGVYSQLANGASGYAGFFVGDLYANGEILSSSDARLKDEIEDIESALAKLNRLKPKQYKMKTKMKDENRRNHLEFGFIAQELKEVYPNLVRLVEQPGEPKRILLEEERKEIGPDGSLRIIPARYDYEYNMDGDPMYAVNYQGLIAQLVSAVQEQDQKIKSITGRKSANNIQGAEELEDLKLELENTKEQYATLAKKVQRLLDCNDCEEEKIEARSKLIDLDLSQLSLKLYPNPVTNILNIEANAEATGLMEVSIFNSSGQRVAYDRTMLIIGKNVHQMNVTEWASGSYFVTTTFQDVSNSNTIVVE